MVRIIDTRSYVNREKRTIVTFIKDEYNNEFKGQSYCSVDDEFNEDFGEKLAYYRAKRKMLRFYRNSAQRHLNNTKKDIAKWEEVITKEINKNQEILDKVENAINEMLSVE